MDSFHSSYEEAASIYEDSPSDYREFDQAGFDNHRTPLFSSTDTSDFEPGMYPETYRIPEDYYRLPVDHYRYPSASISETSTDSYNDLSMSSDIYFYDNESESCSTSVSNFYSRSMSDNTFSSERHSNHQVNGILKNNNNNASESSNESSQITAETIDKIRETELEDILQYARDIIHPDPSARFTYCSQPAKVVQGSFRHVLSIKEMNSKTGAFKYRTIEINRKENSEDLGFSVRQGDGWEKSNGIFISRVSLDSIFDKYEILTVGDEIIQVNKVEIKNMSIDDVIKLMKIPERLCLTIKMLTPFSKKRTESSGIDNTSVKGHKYFPNARKEDAYKVAQMRIATKPNRNVIPQPQPRRPNIVNAKPLTQKERKNLKVSPYRVMEGGILMKQNKYPALSPIPEHYKKSSSIVTWSDRIEE